MGGLGLIKGRFTFGCLLALVHPFNLVLNLIFGLFVDLLHILRDEVRYSEVPLGKIRRQPITFDSFVILFQKFLLNAQVVIRDGQNSDAVFKFLLHGNALRLRNLFPFGHVRQEVNQQCRLDNHYGLVSVDHSDFVPVQLRQHSTGVQVCVCHRGRLVLFRFDV